MFTAIDTRTWVRIPFSAMGYNFNSALDPEGSIYKQVLSIGNEKFIEMNKACVGELWAARVDLDINQLLDVVNLGAHQAIIELAGE